MNSTDNGPQQYTAPQAPISMKKQSGLGIAGFVVSLVGFFALLCNTSVGLVFEFPAFGLSLAGLLIRNRKRGLTIAGIAIASVALLFGLIVGDSDADVQDNPAEPAVSTGVSQEEEAQISQPPQSSAPETPKPTEALPGSVLSSGDYFTFEELKFTYKGNYKVLIENNSEDIVRITAHIVGVKEDGEMEYLQTSAISGIDKTAYEEDLAENGWAVEHTTNMIRPGESLDGIIHIFDYSGIDPKPDIDEDGYYDIVFWVSPQDSEDTVQASTNDPISDVYKIKADGSSGAGLYFSFKSAS